MVRALYFAVAIELFLGGGGRLLEIGPVTLRMILFAVAVAASFWLALHRVDEGSSVRFAAGLVLAFLAVHIPPSIIGLLGGAHPGEVLLDVQPILYWLIAPFFAFVLCDVDVIRATSKLVWICAVLLATAYLAVLALLLTGTVDHLAFYQAASATGEFAFRSDTLLVYKAFLYLGVGVVFLIALRPKGYIWLLALVIPALVMTLTRGFLLSAAVAVLLMLLAERRLATALAALGCALAALWGIWYFAPGVLEGLQDQREISNAIRMEDMRFIADEMTGDALVLGHGFGSPVIERLGIENSYLWLLWKGGLACLLFWIAPLVLCWRAYRTIGPRTPQAPLAAAFFYSVVLVYIQTATNPYLNNPIGLGFVLIALFALRRLAGESLGRSRAAGRGRMAPAS
jgi:hypothetical protein